MGRGSVRREAHAHRGGLGKMVHRERPRPRGVMARVQSNVSVTRGPTTLQSRGVHRTSKNIATVSSSSSHLFSPPSLFTLFSYTLSFPPSLFLALPSSSLYFLHIFPSHFGSKHLSISITLRCSPQHCSAFPWSSAKGSARMSRYMLTRPSSASTSGRRSTNPRTVAEGAEDVEG